MSEATPILQDKTDQKLSNVITSENEVLNILQKLQVSKTGGPDNLPNKVLRLFAPYIAGALSKLFNLSLEKATFPTLWKEANVLGLFKKEEDFLTKNYRPVSLLCSASKVFEITVFNRLYDFLTANNLLTACNSGFKKLDSTVNQLINIVHMISSALDNGKDVRMVFLDISKAFDRVWHRGLLVKLKQLGIGDPLLSWIQSYLSNRKQRVVLDGQFSEWISIESGVPQGSVLGPLLFLVFINDLVDDLTCKVYIFADDTSFLEIVESPEQTVISLNNNLSVVQEWGDKWKVGFNPSKTEEMVISRKVKKVNYPQLKFKDEPVKRVQEHKHLGLIITHNLSWDSHIKSVCTKASSRLGKLRKCMYILPVSALESIYVCGIRPILEYAAPIIDNCTQRSSGILESVQYRAALAVSGCMNTSSRIKVLKCLGWPSLADRRKYYKLLIYFKMVKGFCPPHLSALLPIQNTERHNYLLRNDTERQIPAARTNVFARSFVPSASKLWNSLPNNIRSARSVNVFKIYVKRLLFPARLDHLRHGPRRLNMVMNRLRVDFSALKAHLYTRHLCDTQACMCGHHSETTSHFLLQCPLFAIPRQTFLTGITEILETSENAIIFDNLSVPDKVSICLYGHNNLTCISNCKILDATMKFIQLSNRFSNILSNDSDDEDDFR